MGGVFDASTLRLAGTGRLAVTGSFSVGEWILLDGVHPVDLDREAVALRLSVSWTDGTRSEASSIMAPLRGPGSYNGLAVMRDERDGAGVVICHHSVDVVEFGWAGGAVVDVATSSSPATGNAFAVTYIPERVSQLHLRLLASGEAVGGGVLNH